jgi:hypothetical protein
MQIALFKNSEASFIRALGEAGITYEARALNSGSVMAAGAIIEVLQTVVTPSAIAAMFVAWQKARASRKIILTLRGNKVVHLEGYSAEQAQELIPLVEHVAAIDTQAEDKSG